MGMLLVMRHAKSGRAIGVADHDRPLNDRGQRDAWAAGEMLAGYPIDRVLCSTSIRTRQTWSQALLGGAPQAVVDYLPGLYEAGLADLRQPLRILPRAVSTALLIAHFPGVIELVEHLAIPDDHPAWHAIAAGYPTSAIAVLRFDCPWPALDAGTCRLVDYRIPRG